MDGRVLAVDDSAMMRAVYAHLLYEAGYEMQVASDGRDALSKAEAFKPDVILLDMKMPGVDGWEFLRLARERELLEKTSVIIVTGGENPLSEDGELTEGCAYMLKSVTGDELIALVDSAMGRSTDDATTSPETVEAE